MLLDGHQVSDFAFANGVFRTTSPIPWATPSGETASVNLHLQFSAFSGERHMSSCWDSSPGNLYNNFFSSQCILTQHLLSTAESKGNLVSVGPRYAQVRCMLCTKHKNAKSTALLMGRVPPLQWGIDSHHVAQAMASPASWRATWVCRRTASCGRPLTPPPPPSGPSPLPWSPPRCAGFARCNIIHMQCQGLPDATSFTCSVRENIWAGQACP